MSGFLRPTDDEFAPSWSEDKVDIEPTAETSVVYNPHSNWNIAAQRRKLPIAKNKDHLLYLLDVDRGEGDRVTCERIENINPLYVKTFGARQDYKLSIMNNRESK